MMAQPPAFSTEAATASESVATTTSPTAAARARRKTCTIIGSPAISASGLPGSLVAAIRAGMTIKTSLAAIGPKGGGWQTRAKVSGAWRLYGLPGNTQTGYVGAENRSIGIAVGDWTRA